MKICKCFMSIIKKIKNKFNRRKEKEQLVKKLTDKTSDSWYDVLLSNEPFRYPTPIPPPSLNEKIRTRTL